MEKLRIKGSELVTDIRMGMTDAELIAKHSLSHNLLDRAFDLLVEANRITREELESRKSGLKPSRVTPTNIVSSIPKSIGSATRQSGRQRQEQGHPSKKTPLDCYLEALRKYAVFKGRAQRKDYWFFFLFNSVIALVLVILEAAAGLLRESGVGPLSGSYILAVLIPGIAVLVRRLHDTNRSGWWLFIALIPILGNIALTVFLVQDSQPGENQYGPNPKATKL
jgi:uncharacterized membrane protein YhaH (DUF805 family)